MLAEDAAGAQGLDTPLIIIPPPREQQREQTFLERPVPVRVGNLGENAGSGS